MLIIFSLARKAGRVKFVSLALGSDSELPMGSIKVDRPLQIEILL